MEQSWMRARAGIDMGMWARGNRGKTQPGCGAKAGTGVGGHGRSYGRWQGGRWHAGGRWWAGGGGGAGEGGGRGVGGRGEGGGGGQVGAVGGERGGGGTRVGGGGQV